MSRSPYVPGKEPPALNARPKCAGCGIPLAPQLATNWASPSSGDAVSREWTGRYQGYGFFHSMTCAVRFANAAVKAGFKISKAT